MSGQRLNGVKGRPEGTDVRVSRGGIEEDLRSLAFQVKEGLLQVRNRRARLPALAAEPPVARVWEESLALHLARLGTLVLELANLWVLEKRLGIPRKETEGLDLLVRAGVLAPDHARRLRMVADYRLWVARDLARQDRSRWLNGEEGTEELGLIEGFLAEVSRAVGHPLP